MLNKKSRFILPVIIALTINAFAIDANNRSALELLNRFTLDDMSEIYQSCGNANSLAATCATSFNKIIQTRFKNVKPINASDVNNFWKYCYNGGDNKICTKNINAMLKTHMPENSHYSISERDVNQIKNTNFLESNADYSSLMKQADDFFGSE